MPVFLLSIKVTGATQHICHAIAVPVFTGMGMYSSQKPFNHCTHLPRFQYGDWELSNLLLKEGRVTKWKIKWVNHKQLHNFIQRQETTVFVGNIAL